MRTIVMSGLRRCCALTVRQLTLCALVPVLALLWLGIGARQQQVQANRPLAEVTDPERRARPVQDRQSPDSEDRDRGANGAPGSEAKSGADPAKAPQPIPKSLRRPGASSVPEQASLRAQLLRELYAHLATAQDAQVANRIAAAIERVWTSVGSDTITLLLRRSQLAKGRDNPELALELLDRAIKLAPDNPQLFNERAIIRFGEQHINQALGDLRRALALDPNHFKALQGLGQILKEIGEKKAALKVFRRLEEVHPHLPGVKAAIQELAREVEGRRS